MAVNKAKANFIQIFLIDEFLVQNQTVIVLNLCRLRYLYPVRVRVFWGVGNFNVTNVKGDRFGGTKPGKYGVD